METSPTIGLLAAALAKSQAAFGKLVASRDVEVQSSTGKVLYTYDYANLADALAACRATLNANGIAVLQEPSTPTDGGVEVRTLLVHESGEWMRSGALHMSVSGGAQAIGSAITYARRYQLLAVIGLASEDDDGASVNGSVAPDHREAQPVPVQSTRLQLLQHAVAAKVYEYSGKFNCTRSEAWAEACQGLAKFDRVLGDGQGPHGCGPEDLARIDLALTDALVAK